MGRPGEAATIVFANDTGALTVGRACIDVGRTRVSGHATDARLSFESMRDPALAIAIRVRWSVTGIGHGNS